MNFMGIMKRGPIWYLITCLVLAACVAPVPAATPALSGGEGSTPTATFTSSPSPTLTETPTATATEIAPSPEFLSTLTNFNPDKTYVVDENGYYVDNITGNKWAKLDNGVWRATTPEEQYGHLTLKNPSEPYIPNQNFWQGDINHSANSEYLSYQVNAFWTGDIITDDNGVQKGIFVIRDNNNKLVPMTVWLHSNNVRGDFYIFDKTPDENGISRGNRLVGDPTDVLKPLLGKQVTLRIYYQTPANTTVSLVCNPIYTTTCTDQYNAQMSGRNEQ